MLKARQPTDPADIFLGTNSSTGARFSEWTVPNAKVKPVWGHIRNGRHVIDTDITQIVEDAYGEGATGGATLYAAAILGPNIPGGQKRYQIVEGLTDSNGDFDVSPNSNNRIQSALVEVGADQITNNYGDNCFAAFTKFDNAGDPYVALAVRWEAYETPEQSWFVADNVDLPLTGFEPDTKYWISLELKSTGVVAGIWLTDPGANLAGKTPTYTLEIGKEFSADRQQYYPPDDRRKAAFDSMYAKSLKTFIQQAAVNDNTQTTPITGLRWYPEST